MQFQLYGLAWPLGPGLPVSPVPHTHSAGLQGHTDAPGFCMGILTHVLMLAQQVLPTEPPPHFLTAPPPIDPTFFCCPHGQSGRNCIRVAQRSGWMDRWGLSTLPSSSWRECLQAAGSSMRVTLGTDDLLQMVAVWLEPLVRVSSVVMKTP